MKVPLSPSPPDGNGITLFAAATNLDTHLTSLHTSLPLHTALLLFSWHSNLGLMAVLAARRTEYQRRETQSSFEADGTGDGARRMVARCLSGST